MTSQILFCATKKDIETIAKIAGRAWDHVKEIYGGDKLSLAMDIEATHCNGNPLKLEELLNSDQSDLLHDIVGIHKHMNRDTGRLEGPFVPRFSR